MLHKSLFSIVFVLLFALLHPMATANPLCTPPAQGDSVGSVPSVWMEPITSASACGGEGTSVSSAGCSASITGGTGCVTITTYADGTTRVVVTGNNSQVVVRAVGAKVSIGAGVSATVIASGCTINMSPHAMVNLSVPASGTQTTIGCQYQGWSRTLLPGQKETFQS